MHWKVRAVPCAWAVSMGIPGKHPESVKVSQSGLGAQNSLLGMAGVVPPLQHVPGFCCSGIGNLYFKLLKSPKKFHVSCTEMPWIWEIGLQLSSLDCYSW